MRQKGKVKFYSARRGFGFIICPDGSEVFFHINSCINLTELFEGEEVEFDLVQTSKGYAAERVEKI